MTAVASTPRPFTPGTTGWSADDLRDPAFLRQWELGRYEIVDGILVQMPAAYFDHGEPLPDLIVLIRNHLRAGGDRPRIAVEVDLVCPWGEVFCADAALLTAEDVQRQEAALRQAGLPSSRLQRLLVPPTLVIESVSTGHEQHDRQLKLGRYARLGIPHYWIVDHHQRSIECYRLADRQYTLDTMARQQGVVSPSGFPGFTLDIADLFP